MRSTLFVGLDVGTNTSKAVVFTDAGEPVASGRADTPWMFTSTGAALDANALLAAAKAAISEALADCPPGPIAGVGVASLAEAGVLLGSRGEPVAPVIAWHDTRDHAQLADLLRTITALDFSAMTGLPARQQWSLTKHRWLLDNMPEARRAVRRLTSPNGSSAVSAVRRPPNSRWLHGPGGYGWRSVRGGATPWSGQVPARI